MCTQWLADFIVTIQPILLSRYNCMLYCDNKIGHWTITDGLHLGLPAGASTQRIVWYDGARALLLYLLHHSYTQTS
jgi:hypothetical protein